ncbi:glycosyltransferase family 1 protein [Agromyces badenianii]|uniref:D-inositol 3-phosphate glycosyltransferase n=1 Tax=Agromyces badenianii TaxID=2080742 RepID=A0A2S0WXV8_9MICO|nr:glycosyltransferase family 4 protein [Agromyces badenianii]AWB96148.1 glycosyltransferase family 1 protein [Agromyces badenianii]
MTGDRRVVVLGVTADVSLSLMRGFPEYLSAHGWKVHVVSSTGPRLTELGTSGEVTTHALKMAREPAPFADASSLVSWVRLLRRIRPDVVMVGTPKAGLLGLVAAVLTRVPVRVYHVRGLRLETTRGLARRVYTLLERIAFATSTTAIAVSSSLRDRLIDLRLAQGDQVVVLGRGSSNGVDTKRFRPADPSALRDAGAERARIGLAGVPTVGFVGRLTRDKGLEVLAEACKRLADDGVDHQLLVIGDVEEAESRLVLDQLGAGGYPPVVLGHVPDTAPYYALMDVLCLPTFREGFPNVVLEASASGVPVVTTDATGAVDSVVDDVTGSIARVGDPVSLAAELARLLTNPERAKAMGQAGRELVVASYARDVVWMQTESFLRNLRARRA